MILAFLQVGGGIALLVVSLLSLTQSRSAAGRPRRLMLAGPGTFAVPAVASVRRLGMIQLGLCGFTALVVVIALSSSHTSGVSRIGAITANAVAGVLCVIALTALARTYRRPPVALTVDGVRQAMRSPRWDDLQAMATLPRTLPSATADPVRMTFAEMDADPRFVGAAIAHYLAHPEARPAIGQPDELDRLHRLLTDLR